MPRHLWVLGGDTKAYFGYGMTILNYISTYCMGFRMRYYFLTT